MQGKHAIMLVLLLGLALPAAGEDEVSPFLAAYRDYDAAYQEKDFERAAEFAARALALGREELGPEHEKTGVLAINLGHVLTLLGRYGEAEAPFAEARDIMSTHGGPNHPALLTVYEDLVQVHAGQGRLNPAREALDRAVAVVRKNDGPEDPRIVALLVSRARFEARFGQWQRGLEYFDRALDTAREAFGEDDPRLGDVLYQRGVMNLQRGEARRAESDLLRALALWEDSAAGDNMRLMRAHGGLAVVYDKLNRAAAYRQHSDAMLALVEEGSDQALPLLLTNPRLPEPEGDGDAVTGSALVSFNVGPDGRVREPRLVEHDLPPGYRQAIVEATERWLFRPRFVDGEAAAAQGVRARVVVEAGDIKIHVGSLAQEG